MRRERPATLNDMARIARKYDTTLSRAMLRALGLPLPAARFGPTATRAPSDMYEAIGECFANRRRVRI